jgi:F0F1-type ATP synthase assembly protein I
VEDRPHTIDRLPRAKVPRLGRGKPDSAMNPAPLRIHWRLRLPGKCRAAILLRLRRADWSIPAAERVQPVHDPIAAGRRSALRAVATQAIVVALVAAAFLLQGQRHALAAAGGGAALLVGNVLSTLLAFGGGIQPAGAALVRTLAGALVKWWMALAGLALVLGAWRLPAIPALVGMAMGLVAHSLAMITAMNRTR